MLAMLMTRPGGPEVLQPAELPLPEPPGPQHLRVRLRAAGVNPVDTKLRQNGTYYPDRLPAVLGCDGAGVVDAIGAEVSRFRVGDEVFFFQGGIGDAPGTYAEYTAIHQDYAAAKPAVLSFAEAAALPLVLITAWEALFERARLAAGQHVLIHAGVGGVGHIAVQLARHVGARVAVTVGDAAKAAYARELGAELTIEYRREDFVVAALTWTEGRGVDLTLDTVGGDTFCRSLAATRVYGQLVTLLQAGCDAEVMKQARLRNQTISYELMLSPQFLGLHAARLAQRHILEAGARQAEAGSLKPRVSHVLPLAAAAEAHRLLEAGHVVGKIVLRMD